MVPGLATGRVRFAAPVRHRRETRSSTRDGLPKLCLVLHYYAELSVNEVGEALGISSNSVKTHLQRGIATLRTTLEAKDRT